MTATLLSLISLFVSCFILLLGNGLMNVLMPVRMGLDGMGTDTIGMVQSLYFVGLVFGAAYSKYLIIRAGHIRMFAGCVSFGAATMLACALFEDVWLWGAMRLLLGFCNACAFTAMESWLSDASSKENRGKVLAFYNATVLSGLFVGQFFMNLADPGEATLFIAAGVMLSLAVIPVALSRLSGPPVEDVTSMPLYKLFKVSLWGWLPVWFPALSIRRCLTCCRSLPMSMQLQVSSFLSIWAQRFSAHLFCSSQWVICRIVLTAEPCWRYF